MHHPRIGERVHVRPSNPSVRVQRGESLYGQFLPDDGMECLWDEFLHRRLVEGAVIWSPLTRDFESRVRELQTSEQV